MQKLNTLALPSDTPLIKTRLLSLLSHRHILRFISAMWFTAAYNSVFISKLTTAVNVSAILLLLLLTWLIITLLTPGRLFKPMLIVLIFSSAVVQYYSSNFGVMFDAGMLQNVLETDIHEVKDLLSFKFASYFAVFALLPTLVVWQMPNLKLNRCLRVQRYLLIILVNIALIGSLALTSYQSLSGYFRVNKEQRYYATPLNIVAAVNSQLKKHLATPVKEFTRIASNVTFVPFSAKPTVFILVLGETARADHFTINGYQRDTTPNLSKLPIVNFAQVSSCGTATAHSVPCMFSWMNKADYDENIAKNSENLVDIVKRAGFDVLWRDNDNGCKDVCNRVTTENLYQSANIHCEDGCPDEVLLEHLPNLLQRQKNLFIVLHQQGSHGPAYYRRSHGQQVVFAPACQDETFATCNQQEIINAYDNSLVATDDLLGKLVTTLAAMPNVNTGLWYVSDHGESLGENGVYLHGLPYSLAPDAQTHVPMLFWLSNNYLHDAQLNLDCLHKTAAQATSHDALFGSVLGLLSIQVTTNKDLTDLITPCRSTYAQN
ncbi:phosphoethanolamine transferase [Pseudoalteromonas fenneropenaei]|uniref:Phosphoethanolamine transferase n=1 Tax=Pseudoalteromonas fenneropenaei TaxID=1737459 RepID=A0ABV7CPV5_9GAMM